MSSTPDPEPVVAHVSDVASSRPGAEHVPPRLDVITNLIAGDLVLLEGWLARAIERDSNCATAASDLIRAGGKRLRPALVLLFSRLHPNAPKVSSNDAMRLGVAVEMLHAATLLHDDVIDDAPLRRGHPSARYVWGNAVSVIGGDLLLVRALQTINALEDRRLDRLTTHTLQDLVLGEVEQLERRGRLDMDVDTFERIASRKTASLFVLAAVGAGLLRSETDATLDAIREFAISGGLAFQLDDDLLDLCATPQAIGKAIGQDLLTGSVTLPVADVLAKDPELLASMKEHLETHPGEPLPEWIGSRLLAASTKTGALERSRGLVQTYGKRASDALAKLPEGHARKALSALIDLLVWRSSGQHDPMEERRYEA